MFAERPSADGFTLPEILVAFLVLALALGVLLPSFSTGFAGLDASAFHAAALAHARSEIDRLGTEIPMEEGELTGRSQSGMEWVMRLRPTESHDPRRPSEGDAAAVVPYEIELTIFNAAGRSLTLRTLRLAPAE
jgi:general secretion pathway protein I